MGVAVADFDNDGRLDIAKTNFLGDLTSLFHNDDGRFYRCLEEAGLAARQLLGWGVAFIDVDDDGWKDLVIANGHVYPEVDNAKIGESYYQPMSALPQPRREANSLTSPALQAPPFKRCVHRAASPPPI